MRRNHYYFQFGFLTLGVCARILFVNADRTALVGIFAFILLLFAGDWPALRRQDLVQLSLPDLGDPGHLHRSRRPVRFEGAPRRDPGRPIDVPRSRAERRPEHLRRLHHQLPRYRSREFLLENPRIRSKAVYVLRLLRSRVRVLYLLFRVFGRLGLLHERRLDPRERADGQVAEPRVLFRRCRRSRSRRSSPLRFTLPSVSRSPIGCGCWIERGYARLGAPARQGPQQGEAAPPDADGLRVPDLQPVLRIRRPAQHPADADLGGQTHSTRCLSSSSVTWLVRSLARDAELYSRERVARSLRDQLVRMGFRSEDMLEGRPIDQLSADEVYVLAKTLPNFSVAQKREAYRAILTEALRKRPRQIGREPEAVERRPRAARAYRYRPSCDHRSARRPGSGVCSIPRLADRSNFRFAARTTARSSPIWSIGSAPPASSPRSISRAPQAQEAIGPVRTFFGISEEDHARIVGEIGEDRDTCHRDRPEPIGKAPRTGNCPALAGFRFAAGSAPCSGMPCC